MGIKDRYHDLKEGFWKRRSWISLFLLGIVIGYPLFSQIINDISGVRVSDTGRIILFISYTLVFIVIESEKIGSLSSDIDDIKSNISDLESQIKATKYITGRHDISNEAQIQANDHLRDVLQKNSSDINQVDILVYSSGTIQRVIQTASDIPAKIRLLVKSPTTADPPDQPEKIIEGLDNIRKRCGYNSGILIKVYDENASVRGIKIDEEMLNIGWYTYDNRDPERDEQQVWGSPNSMIITTPDDPEAFSSLNTLFTEIFESFWSNGESLEEVNDEYINKWVQEKEVSQEWLQEVSENNS